MKCKVSFDKTVKVYSNIKVFDINNPNCKIKNINEICSLISDNKIPIVNKIYDFKKDKLFKTEDIEVIGYVMGVDEVLDGEYYGRVAIFNGKSFEGKFINYCISGEVLSNNEFFIDKIDSIQII